MQHKNLLKRLSAFMLCMVMVLVSTNTTIFAKDSTTKTKKVIGYGIVSLDEAIIGNGFIIEPTAVEIYEGDKVAHVLVRAAQQQNVTLKYNGDIENSDIGTKGFYLSSVQDNITTDPILPEFILKHFADPFGEWDNNSGFSDEYKQEQIDITKNEMLFDYGRGEPGWLGEFDYSAQSGWMYMHNGQFANGASSVNMSPGDVTRWQFTLALGSDLGMAEADAMGKTENLTPPVKKDNLVRILAYTNKFKEKFLTDPEYKKAYDEGVRLATTIKTEKEQSLSLQQSNIDKATATLKKHYFKALGMSALPAVLSNLTVQTDLQNCEWTTDTAFSYELTTNEDYGNKIILPKEKVLSINPNTPNHTKSFENIIFNAEGSYTFCIKQTALNPLKDILYDTERQLNVIVKQEDTGSYYIESVQIANDKKVEYVDQKNINLTYTNAHAMEPITLSTLKVQSIINGRDWLKDDTFTYSISCNESTDKVIIPKQNTLTIKKDTLNHSAVFPNIVFTQPGQYTLCITQNTKSSVKITPDETVKYINVTVIPAQNYTLKISIKDNENVSTFINRSYYAADTTNDGKINANDLLAVLNTYGLQNQNTDIDKSGFVDANDLLQILNMYGYIFEE